MSSSTSTEQSPLQNGMDDLRALLRIHKGNLQCVQQFMCTEQGSSLLDVYIACNIRHEISMKTNGVYQDKVGISRSTSLKASDPKFVALMCNKCHRPNKDLDDAISHHTNCYQTCINLCGCKITVSSEIKQNNKKKSKEKLACIAQSIHDEECIMMCKCGVSPPHLFDIHRRNDNVACGYENETLKCKHV